MTQTRISWAVATLTFLFVPARSHGAEYTNALILNQANTVSGSRYLQSSKYDPIFNRIQGNGQNWMQLLTTKTDPGKHTLNLQEYEINWSYNKDNLNIDHGSGTIKFSNDPVWAAVPQGTLITINEYKQAWYLIDTPPTPGNPEGDLPLANGGGGMQRDGGFDGFGTMHGSPYSDNPLVEKLFDFSSNTAWNPYAEAGANMQPGPNWNINVWAGQQSGGNFQYFSYTGTIYNNGVPATVGTPAGGLFTSNNDNWQFTIKDSQGNFVQGPIGEAVGGWAAGGVGPQEIVRLEAFPEGSGATVADFQNVTIANYSDGSSSSYGGPSRWTSGPNILTEDLSPLRAWFNDIQPGDVNLDGIVNGQDIALAASNWLQTGVNLMAGDANGDGIVNGQDIAQMASNWLAAGGAPASGAASAVPEPASCLICAIGMVVGLAWRWRHSRRRG